jgi:hypothetical protein
MAAALSGRAFAVAHPAAPAVLRRSQKAPSSSGGNVDATAKQHQQRRQWRRGAHQRLAATGEGTGAGSGADMEASTPKGAGGGELDDVASGYADAGPTIADVTELLAVAVRGEDYAQAAVLRDRLSALKGDSTKGVTDANERFYQAEPFSTFSAT